MYNPPLTHTHTHARTHTTPLCYKYAYKSMPVYCIDVYDSVCYVRLKGTQSLQMTRSSNGIPMTCTMSCQLLSLGHTMTRYVSEHNFTFSSQSTHSQSTQQERRATQRNKTTTHTKKTNTFT